MLVLGLCATSYTLRRQDAEYFGGHRETVLARDGYRCRVPECTTLKRGKWSVAVHDRIPGNINPKLMLTLYLACHAKVIRTLFVEDDWPPFRGSCGGSSIPTVMTRPGSTSQRRVSRRNPCPSLRTSGKRRER